MTAKKLHLMSAIIGAAFLILSCIQALFFAYPHFYTAFAMGSWLVLDYIDYKVNGTSILGYFLSRGHRDAFLLFFIVSTIFCFIVDYVYGVKVTGVWVWVDYQPIHFIRMYIFMNVSFLFSMYELYRLVNTVLRKRVRNDNLIDVRIKSQTLKRFYAVLFGVGVVCLIVPLYTYFLHTDAYVGYAAALPFFGMFFIVDCLTFYLGDMTILHQLLRFNKLFILSFGITALIGVLVTETLNRFGGEWRYVGIPFGEVRIIGIPIMIILGWFPLVISAIAMVNLVKHMDYLRDHSQHLISRTRAAAHRRRRQLKLTQKA